jgi:hypothetical protein
VNEYFEEIKEVLDCKDYGHYLVSCCPFHSESRPSFFVYEDTYRCASCGEWGKTENLLHRIDKTRVKYKDHETHFVNPFSRWLRNKTLSEVCKSAWETINYHPSIAGYIYNRGVEERYRKALGIGYLDDWYTIPIYSNTQRLVGCVARANPETQTGSKYTQPHGQSPNLLYAPNWRLYDRADVVYVTYGIFDAITLAINGVMALSSISGKLTNPIGLVDIRKKIVIIPDLGEEREAHILASKLGWRGHVAHIIYPEKCKDLSDIWMKDQDLFKEMLHGLG